MKQVTCRKSLSERYDVRIPGTSAWGIFTLSDNGGIFSVTSDYGNYSHNWPSRGPQSLKEFLVGIDTDYLLGKICNGRRDVINVPETIKSWKKCLKGLRRQKSWVYHLSFPNGGPAAITKKIARDAWTEIDELESIDGSQLIDHAFRTSHLQVIEDLHEYVVSGYDPQAIMFTERLWPAFIAILKSEINGTYKPEILAQGVTGEF